MNVYVLIITDGRSLYSVIISETGLSNALPSWEHWNAAQRGTASMHLAITSICSAGTRIRPHLYYYQVCNVLSCSEHSGTSVHCLLPSCNPMSRSCIPYTTDAWVAHQYLPTCLSTYLPTCSGTETCPWIKLNLSIHLILLTISSLKRTRST